MTNMDWTAGLMPAEHTLLYHVRAGSWLHGLQDANSDVDHRGIVQPPRHALLGALVPLEHWRTVDHGVVLETTARYVRELCRSNATVWEVLWAPADCVEHVHPCILALRQVGDGRNRALVRTYVGMAKQALKDMHRPPVGDTQHGTLYARWGYNPKRGALAVRMARMAWELVQELAAPVRRPDAAELLTIKHGGWSPVDIEAHTLELLAQVTALLPTCALPANLDPTPYEDWLCETQWQLLHDVG